MSEADTLPLVTIPYAFARRFGVVLQPGTDGRLSVALREGADPQVLLEVRRHLAQSFDVSHADAPTFDSQAFTL